MIAEETVLETVVDLEVETVVATEASDVLKCSVRRVPTVEILAKFPSDPPMESRFTAEAVSKIKTTPLQNLQERVSTLPVLKNTAEQKKNVSLMQNAACVESIAKCLSNLWLDALFIAEPA